MIYEDDQYKTQTQMNGCLARYLDLIQNLSSLY